MFFHKSASSQRQTNRIRKLTNSSRTITTDEANITKVIINYFHNIFNSKDEDSYVVDCVNPTNCHQVYEFIFVSKVCG